MMNTSAARFSTLDVLRGMTIFLMIVVNTPGSGAIPYAPLEHAQWNGCTLTDLVFPSFLFAVGNAMPFAAKKFQNVSEKIFLLKVFKRAVLIFVVGYLLAWYTTMHFVNGHIAFAPFTQTRIMAVLQRIAICYCITALLFRYCSSYTVIVFSILILFIYWLVLYGFGDAHSQFSVEGNAVRKLDLAVLGEQHMYRERGVVFDPEGLLSTLPATVNVIAGYFAGTFIIQKSKTYETVAKLAVAGSLLILSALFWNLFFPINKKLWTSSYVLYTTGIDLLALCVLFYTIELKRWKKGMHFFVVLGRNPLFIYVLSNLFLFFIILPVTNDKIFIDWINEILFQKIAPGPFGSLLFAISFAMIFWFIAWIMDKKKVYIRL